MRTMLTVLVLLSTPASSSAKPEPPEAIEQSVLEYTVGGLRPGSTAVADFVGQSRHRLTTGKSSPEELLVPPIRGVLKYRIQGGRQGNPRFKVGDVVPAHATFDFVDGVLVSFTVGMEGADGESTKAFFIREFGEPTPSTTSTNLIWDNGVSSIDMRIDGGLFTVRDKHLMGVVGQRVTEYLESRAKRP